MATHMQQQTIEGPLRVVLRPGSDAEAAYRSAVLAPGFEPDVGLDLQDFGGRKLAHLTYTLVYLGRWRADERSQLDAALAAAMHDRRLNRVLEQYFPGEAVRTTFTGSHVHPGSLPARVDRGRVESIVRTLDLGGAVACLLLPRGTVLVEHLEVDSKHGLGGYHGSIHVGRARRYYTVAVYSEGPNGIVAFDEPWKNVCATLYHELQETRTDPDVEDAIRAGSSPDAEKLLGWYSPRGGEIGDIPIAEAGGRLDLVMKEVPLADGSGDVPVQLMWSNADGGPASG
jgi:hypothetical protein